LVHDAASIRRVCMQMGLGSPNTGGGSIVFVTGTENGDVAIDTLRGEHLVAHPPHALCLVGEQKMRVCPADAQRSAEVNVEDTFDGAKSTAKIGRGEPLAFYEYVSGGGETKAVVNIGGKARFISADDVCHLETPLPTSRATDAFKMILSVYGGPHAFRPRSTEGIKRIVIHNTEVPLRETLNHFGRLEANTSAHIVIDRDGTTYRVVEDQFAAFHAGASKDGLGGYNSTSLGIEVVAFDDAKYGGEPHANAFFSDAQRQAVIRLVDFWMNEYKLEIDPEVMQNRSSAQGYTDLEYRQAAVTIHRLTKADRGTDCPRLLFPNSPDGDESFFRWREQTFSKAARQARASSGATSPASSASGTPMRL
jgi:N-acetyl-anhydromuramyl-L-alanine amidase AmpD